MKLKIVVLLTSVLLLTGILRFWQLGSVPPGLNVDEVSEGYNAYSLLKTGRDRYGMVMPIIFKSFGSYQPPIYTYLTTLPIMIFGPTIFAVKTVSALSGLTVVLFTFLIIKDFFFKKNDGLALFISLVVAISPWTIFFSRMATEASPALAIFISGFYFLLKSTKKIEYLSLAALLLGLATHTYYSERIISPLLLVSFVLINWKYFLKNKKWLLIGIIIFGLTQIPHLAILKSGALTRRLEQVTYFGRDIPVIREFASQYSAYFSPRSLFFESDDQGARSMPDLSVFYKWMIIPYFFGFAYLIKNYKDKFVKNLFLLMFLAPLPASVTTEPFYTLRVFELLWVFTVVIAIGIWQLFSKIKQKNLRYMITSVLFALSLASFYINYFVLFKYERSHTVSYSNRELIKITEKMPNRNFVIDYSRDISIGVRVAFFRQYDPALFQEEIGKPFLKSYYSSTDAEQSYRIENVEVRGIDWREDVYKDQIIAGDTLAISEDQAKEHKLKLEFEIKNLNGEVSIRGYSTNPKEKCLSSEQKNVNCKKWL